MKIIKFLMIAFSLFSIIKAEFSIIKAEKYEYKSPANLIFDAGKKILFNVRHPLKLEEDLSELSTEELQEKFNTTIEQVLAAEPIGVMGHISRDVFSFTIAYTFAALVNCGVAINFDGPKPAGPNEAVTILLKHPEILILNFLPLFPILRYLFDNLVQETNNPEKCLDLLIRIKNINSKSIQFYDNDITKIEDKIITLKKNEGARWSCGIVAMIVASILFFSFVSLTDVYSGQKALAQWSTQFIAFIAEMVIQSESRKKSSRLKKLAELKKLVTSTPA